MHINDGTAREAMVWRRSLWSASDSNRRLNKDSLICIVLLSIAIHQRSIIFSITMQRSIKSYKFLKNAQKFLKGIILIKKKNNPKRCSRFLRIFWAQVTLYKWLGNIRKLLGPGTTCEKLNTGSLKTCFFFEFFQTIRNIEVEGLLESKNAQKCRAS